MARKVLLQFRRDTAANWTSTNPVLAAGEPGYETDTGKIKFGDGATAWNALAYFSAGGSSPLTTKGDLYGHSTVDARVPVGADGTVLQADSTQTLGVKYATVPSGSGGALTLIGSQSLGADGASLSVGSIPGTYSTLKVVLSLRSATAALTDNAVVQFNGDTTVADYVSQATYSHGSTVSGLSITTTRGMGIQIVGSSGTHDYFSAIELLIPRYNLTGSDVDKLINFQTSDLATGPVLTTQSGAGSWAQSPSAAITSITVVTGTGANLKQQSYLSVYGMS